MFSKVLKPELVMVYVNTIITSELSVGYFGFTFLTYLHGTFLNYPLCSYFYFLVYLDSVNSDKKELHLHKRYGKRNNQT